MNNNEQPVSKTPTVDHSRAFIGQGKTILHMFRDYKLGQDILVGLIDPIIFSLVYIWVMLNYAKHVRHYKQEWNRKTGLPPHAVLPRCLNDKYLWRKIFDRNPEFTTISDKLAVKDWLIENDIDVLTPKTIWTGQDANDIPRDILNGNVIIKANHGWNMYIPIRNGEYDHDELVEKANSFLEKTHGDEHLEWGYFNIPRKLFVEEFIIKDGHRMIELKYFTFGNRLERLYVICDRFNEVTKGVYMAGENGEFLLTDEKLGASTIPGNYTLPPINNRAEEIARDIGSRFDHMRVDFITNGKEIWLGELTIYSSAGKIPKYGVDLDIQMNAAWDLRRSWFLTTPQKGWRRLYAAALRRWLDRNDRKKEDIL